MTSFLGFFIPGGPELWIILAIFLLLFGHRIPKMARSMGSGIVEFKRGLKDSGSSETKDGDDNDTNSDSGGSPSGKITVEPDVEGSDSRQDPGTSNG